MLSTVRFRGHLLTNRAAASATRPADVLVQFFSGKSDDDDDSNKTIPFRPRRRSSPEYRPLSPRKVKTRGPIDPNTNPTYLDNIVLGENDEGKDELESAFGPYAADAIRHSRQKRSQNIESSLRMADFMTARPGTTEHLVGERRAMAMDLWDNEDREEFMTGLDRLIEEERVRSMELGDDDMEPPHETDLKEDEEADPNQLVHGDWAESVIQVDRVQKVQRGGTMVRYRALLIGGNGQGAAGFGVAKANTPSEATTAASRMCRRNVFFVDRYQNQGLTRDLVGKNNSCKVILRATPPNWGLRGHELVKEILILLGVTDFTAKTHGNRNPYNVVRATFKAIMTHESMEEISLKRGKRLLNLDRVKRLQI